MFIAACNEMAMYHAMQLALHGLASQAGLQAQR
jgi:hypothetical protein